MTKTMRGPLLRVHLGLTRSEQVFAVIPKSMDVNKYSLCFKMPLSMTGLSRLKVDE